MGWALVSQWIERFIFWSRWLLAPLYVGLIGALGLLAYRYVVKFISLMKHISIGTDHVFLLDLLSLLDLVLMGNLILIVLFAGYENFVSKIDIAENSVDRPYWMGTIDFSGLKIKLIGSLVAISVIELLRDFISLSAEGHHVVTENVTWRVVIHLTFVVSGVLFSVMDWISDNRVIRTYSLHHQNGQPVIKDESVVNGVGVDLSNTPDISRPPIPAGMQRKPRKR